MRDDTGDLIELLSDRLCIFAGNGTDVQCMDEGTSGNVRHTGDPGYRCDFINRCRVNDIGRLSEGICDFLCEQTAEVCRMVTMQGNGQIVNDRIIDEIGSCLDRMEVSAAADTCVKLVYIVILFFQIVHDYVVAEVQLIDGFGELCHFTGRMFEDCFRNLLIVFE